MIPVGLCSGSHLSEVQPQTMALLQESLGKIVLMGDNRLTTIRKTTQSTGLANGKSTGTLTKHHKVIKYLCSPKMAI